MIILSSLQVQISRLSSMLLHLCEWFNCMVTSPPSFTKKSLSKFYNSTDLQRHVSLTSIRVLLRRVLVNSAILRDCNAKFHLLAGEGSGMVNSVAVVPTTSIRVKESPCILVSPSTASMTTTPRLSGTAVEVDKDGAAVLGNALDNIRHQSSAAEDGCLACGGSRPALAATTQLSKPL